MFYSSQNEQRHTARVCYCLVCVLGVSWEDWSVAATVSQTIPPLPQAVVLKLASCPQGSAALTVEGINLGLAYRSKHSCPLC